MKKTLAAATVAVLGVAGAANAADIYSQGGLKDVPYVAAPTWTGFYVGANVGGAWANLKETLGADITGQGFSWDNYGTGVIGGGQVGYNYQTGAFVFGLEADFGGIGLSHSHLLVPDSRFSSRDNSGFYADVTGRLGYAAGPALFYAKGGWAYFDGEVSYRDSAVPANNGTHTGVDGWTVGGGIEYKLSPAWGLKGEYQYFDFGATDLKPFNGTGTVSADLTVNVAKVGVNYYFGNVYSPLK
jgi:outer membrane immunogenic protein